MSIVHVASQGTFNAAVTTREFTVSPAALGNMLLVGVDSAVTAANPSISDTGGHTWNVCNVLFRDNPHHQALTSWYTFATVTSSITITVASNVAADWISTVLDEFSGVESLDQHIESTPEGSASNPAIGNSMTPAVNNELVWAFGVGMISATGSIDGSAALPGGDSGGDDRSEYRIMSGRAGVPMTCSFSTYDPFKYNILSATFRPTRNARVVVRKA
jgi:hypothetical protein